MCVTVAAFVINNPIDLDLPDEVDPVRRKNAFVKICHRDAYIIISHKNCLRLAIWNWLLDVGVALKNLPRSPSRSRFDYERGVFRSDWSDFWLWTQPVCLAWDVSCLLYVIVFETDIFSTCSQALIPCMLQLGTTVFRGILSRAAEFLRFCRIRYWLVIRGQIWYILLIFSSVSGGRRKLVTMCRQDCAIKYKNATRALMG